MHRNEVEMIIGKDVCKSFEGFKALDNASFHVKKGSGIWIGGTKRCR